jgi:ComEC/Rec2-related protein
MFERWFSRGKRAFLIGFLLCCYIGSVPTSATLLRTCLLWGIRTIAPLFGREYQRWWSFFLITTAMILARPGLVLDFGFELSSLAMIAIFESQMTFSSSGYRRLSLIYQLYWQIFVPGFYIFCYTFPVILSRYREINLWGLITLPLSFWMIQPIFLCTIIVGVVGAINMRLAEIFVFPLRMLLNAIITMGHVTTIFHPLTLTFSLFQQKYISMISFAVVIGHFLITKTIRKRSIGRKNI